MGRITYGMLQSLDGFIADLGGDITLPPPSPALHAHFNAGQRAAAVSVYGRRMYETMRYWAGDDPRRGPVEREFAEVWQATPKLVTSTTLTEVDPGFTLVTGDVVEAMRDLKERTAGDIEVSGAVIAAALGRAGLVDEYRLYVQPVVLGAGRPFFADGFVPTVRLIGTESLPDDVTLIRLETVR